MDASQLRWRKSSHSGEEYNCVEVAAVPGAVAVRDSKDPGGPTLTFDRTAWRAFRDDVGRGRFFGAR